MKQDLMPQPRPGAGRAGLPGSPQPYENTPPLQEAIGRSRWDALVVLAMACAIGYQLFLPPVVGLANNGDFERLMGRVGLQYTVQGYEDKYFSYIITRFRVVEPWWNSGVISSQQLLLKIALVANRVLSKDGFLDLRVIGAVNAVFFLASVWLALYASRPFPIASRTVLLGLVALIFVDVGYVAYFNSIYSEPASLIFFILVLAASFFAIAALRPNLWHLALYSVAAALFISARAHNSTLGWLLALWGVRLFWRWPMPSWRLGVLATAAALAALSYWHYTTRPAFIREAQLYNAVFSGILVNSPSPGEDLSALGLDPRLAELANTNAFQPNSALKDDEFRRVFFGVVGQTRIVWFYITRPGAIVRAARLQARDALLTRPPCCGNFPKESGYRPRAQSRAFAVWSDLRTRWHVSLGILVSLFISQLGAGVVAVRRSASLTSRLLSELFIILGLMAVVQYVTKFVGDGLLDTGRQLHLFNVLIDTSFIIVVLWVVNRFRDVLLAYTKRPGRRPEP